MDYPFQIMQKKIWCLFTKIKSAFISSALFLVTGEELVKFCETICPNALVIVIWISRMKVSTGWVPVVLMYCDACMYYISWTLLAGTKPRNSWHWSNGGERCEKRKWSTIFLERMREGRRQSDKHWNISKAMLGKLPRDGAEHVWAFPSA